MNKALFNKHMKLNKDTQITLSDAMGMAQSALNARINGKTDFRKSEINFIRRRWCLTDHETIDIFFDDIVSGQDTISA